MVRPILDSSWRELDVGRCGPVWSLADSGLRAYPSRTTMTRARRRGRAPKMMSPLLAVALLWVAAGSVAARGIDTPDSAGQGPVRAIGFDVSYPQCDDELPDR